MNKNSVKSKQLKKQMLEAMEKNMGNVSASCRKLGVTRGTYYKMLEDPDFKAKIDEMADLQLDFVEGKMYERINQLSDTMIIFFLKCKGKHRGYIDRQELKIGLDEETREAFKIGDKEITF